MPNYIPPPDATPAYIPPPDIASAYAVPGLNEASSESNRAERKRSEDWLTQRERLSGAKNDRAEALKTVDSPEKFAYAYGIDPKEVPADELWKAYVDFKNKQAPQGVIGSFTQALSRAMPFGGDTQSGRLQDLISQRMATGPNARRIPDLRAKVNEETYQGATSEHPIAAFTGEALGSAPLAAAFPMSVGGAALGGATMASLTPNISEDKDWYDLLRKAGIGAGIGGGAAYGIGKLVKLGTKGGAAITGKLPAGLAEEQGRIASALDIPESNIAAADLANSKIHPAYRARELARMAGSERVLGAEEQNLGALNRKAGDLYQSARAETAQTPFSRETDLVGPLQPGEVLQESLPIERAGRQSELVTPAYNEAEALLPNDGRRTNTGGLVSQFESMVQKMRDKGGGSIYTHPMASVRGEAGPTAISTLETQLENIRGKAPVADPMGGEATQSLAYPPQAEPLVKAMKSSGFTDEQIVLGLRGQGFKEATLNKTPGIPPTAASPSNAEAFDTVKKLLDVKDNLAAARDAYGASNDQTHFIQKAMDAIDEHLAPYTNSSEWQAYLQAQGGAKRLASEQTMPYHGTTIEGLMKDLPNRAENVGPQTALNKATGLDVDKTRLVNSLLEPKGRAALREGLLGNMNTNAADSALPKGFQINPKALAGEIKTVLDKGVLTQSQSSELEGVQNAIQKLQTMGSRNASPGSASDQGEVAVANMRSRLKAIMEIRHKLTAPFQYSPRGKAWLLTPSALEDPALKGTNLQKFLQIIQSKAPNIGYSASDSTVDNPVDPTQ